jgi:large subunit ribosomal protein L14
LIILKETVLIPADKCGVETVKVFHLYKGFNRKHSFVGDFVKISVKRVVPDNWIKKKTKLKGILVRTKFNINLIDGTNYRFKENNVVLLKKRLTPKGKEILGPTSRKLKRKKFTSSFAGSI